MPRIPCHGKVNGVHYTPVELAEFLAGQTRHALGCKSGRLHVLDPACGDGVLLRAFAKAMPVAARRRLVLTGYEMDPAALAKAKATLAGLGVGKVVLREQDFLSVQGVERTERSLFEPEKTPAEQFDAIIANPPYVRTQVLGAKRSRELAERFDLSGRVDLYHAFVKAMANVLKPRGVLGLLTSNRFLTVKSGVALRKVLRTEFALKSIYDLGDTKLFSAAVLPVVLVACKRPTDSSSCTFDRVYEHRKGEGDPKPNFAYPTILEALQERTCAGLVQTRNGLYCLERGLLSATADEAWRLSTPVVDAWLKTIFANRECVFSDVAKVRVGIKTTADEVFIRDDWDQLPAGMRPEGEILRPLITHFEAVPWLAVSNHRPKHVLYPHAVQAGKRMPVPLADYPKAAAYLRAHEVRLQGRKYVLDAGRKWYEIWVPQNPDDWKKPKIVFPDISEFPRFLLDTSGAIVNGDCYWMTLNDGAQLDWLLLMLAVANSTFITRYYDTVYHNKLYSGRRRFMTQYVSGFPLPPLGGPCGKKIVRLVSRLVEGSTVNGDVVKQIDPLVWESFGLGKEVAG